MSVGSRACSIFVETLHAAEWRKATVALSTDLSALSNHNSQSCGIGCRQPSLPDGLTYVCQHQRSPLLRGVTASAAVAATDVITHEALHVQRVPALSVCCAPAWDLQGCCLSCNKTYSLLQDNYVWILTERSTGKVAVVDPSEAKPVISALQQRWA